MNAQVAETILSHSAVINLGMSIVQKVKADCMSFGGLANTVLSMVKREGSRHTRIDVVLDVYKDNSIKDSEQTL